jgi:hypothetical protein
MNVSLGEPGRAPPPIHTVRQRSHDALIVAHKPVACGQVAIRRNTEVACARQP